MRLVSETPIITISSSKNHRHCHTHRSHFGLELARVCFFLASAMGWTEACQKQGWDQYSYEEWQQWIAGMPATGYGPYDKNSWLEWFDYMLAKHGLPEKRHR